MNIRSLARELADLQIETGYTFQDGTPFHEKLGEQRAERMLKALQDHGYTISHDNQPSTGQKAA
jgi:hypothetical protein